jgi:GntR family transcriptional regulator
VGWITLKDEAILTLEDFRIDPSRPIYEQFVEQIRARIAGARIAAGARLPSVRDLAAIMRINPTTAARTYQELERMGLIVTYRGQGTFVTKDAAAILEAKKAMAQEAVRQLKETAESIGLTMKDMIKLAGED